MSRRSAAPARWLVLAVPIPSAEIAAALLTEGLMSLGGRAVWEENGRLVTHVPEPEDPTSFLRRAQAELRASSRLHDLALETRWQPHEDWAETWKRGLGARRVAPHLVVTPTWESPQASPGDIVVRLDPGMAFGNAEHGTTRGCLRLLAATLSPGERLLDVGTGSGVLSIAAALLGAGEVLALEADPIACEVARENLARNGASERVSLREGRVEADTFATLGTFQGVLANLDGGTLRSLLPGLPACLASDAWVILSGLLASETGSLQDLASRLGLALAATDEDGEWRSLLLRPAAPPG